MSIESRRLPGMRKVVDILLSPFEAATLSQWRSDTLCALRELFDAPKGFLYTPQLESHDVDIECQGVEPAQMEEYARDWITEDLSQAAILHEVGSPVATRETMWYETGWTPEQIEAYERSPIWNDYHKRWGMTEGTGYFITHEPEPGTVYLHSGFWATGDCAANPMFFREGMEVANALAPAFAAGIKLATLRAHLNGSVYALIDALPGALAVLDARGHIVHRNRMWTQMLPPHTSSAIEARGSLLARATLRPSRCPQEPMAPARMAVADMLLTASRLSLPGLPGTFVLLVAEPKSPPVVDYRAHALQLGLPPRLAEVAALIATGHSNAEIAAALRIRPSTARRHTERLLGRLGVGRRAGVAARLVSNG